MRFQSHNNSSKRNRQILNNSNRKFYQTKLQKTQMTDPSILKLIKTSTNLKLRIRQKYQNQLDPKRQAHRTVIRKIQKI